MLLPKFLIQIENYVPQSAILILVGFFLGCILNSIDLLPGVSIGNTILQFNTEFFFVRILKF